MTELRTQIASLYNNVSSDEILVHAGAEEAIFNFMNVALDPGDEIIVHSPYYQSLGEVAHGSGTSGVAHSATFGCIEGSGEPGTRKSLTSSCL